MILGTFFLSCAAAWTWRFYEQRPRPHYVSVSVSPISVTRLEKNLYFPPLSVTFSESAALLEDLHKPSLSGVRLEPAFPGTWRWADDRRLVFQPSEDWPAEKKFRIIFDPKFFPRHLRFESLSYEAQTPSFTVTIKDVQLYQDLTNPTQRQITATFELSHSVEPGELERHVALPSLGGSDLFPAHDAAPHFTITYGSHRRLVFLRSSPVHLPENDDFVKIFLSKGVRTSQGGAITVTDAEQKLRIPSSANIFQIRSSEGTSARNKTGEPEQLLIVQTTADITTHELAKALEIRLLPKRKSKRKQPSYPRAATKTKATQKAKILTRKGKARSQATIARNRNRPCKRTRNGSVPATCQMTF